MTSLLRTALPLLLLSALATAAPAPLPREKRMAEPGGWSKPVEGLRARLVAKQTRYRAGDVVRLMLEIQNVSGSTLAIDEPKLYHYVAAPDQRSSGWVITAERAQESVETLERGPKLLELLKDRSAVRKLDAGATLRIEIAASSRLMEQLKQPEDKDEPRRQDLHFSDGDVPGVYELRVTYRRGSERRKFREGGWNGESLTSPPVRIEILE